MAGKFNQAKEWKMFWTGKQKKNFLDVRNKGPDIQIVPPADRVNSLNLRRDVLDWKDKHVTNIELHLNRSLPVLMSSIDEEFDKLSIVDSTFKLGKVHKDVIQPLIKDWAIRESRQLLEEAQKELLSIHGLVLEEVNHKADIEAHASKGHVVDAATATAAGISGIAAIPVFTSASIVSTGGILGLLGATTVSLPVAIFGAAVVGVLFTFGGIKFGGIKKRALKRYRDHIQTSVRYLVIDSDKRNERGLCGQLQDRISQAADYIIDEIQV